MNSFRKIVNKIRPARNASGAMISPPFLAIGLLQRLTADEADSTARPGKIGDPVV
jgi:hypothetical protein